MFYIFGFYKFKRFIALKKLKKIFEEKLIKNNPTMTLMFRNLESPNQESEQKGIGSNLLIGKEE